MTNEQIVAEMKWTEKAIADVTGYRVKYMRPPYGDIDDRVRFVLKKMGYVVVDWGGDTFDVQDWKSKLGGFRSFDPLSITCTDAGVLNISISLSLNFF